MDPADVRKAMLVENLKLEDPKTAEYKSYFWSGIDPYRIKLAVGRDVILNPPQSGEPLNTFGYPFAKSVTRPSTGSTPPPSSTSSPTKKNRHSSFTLKGSRAIPGSATPPKNGGVAGPALRLMPIASWQFWPHESPESGQSSAHFPKVAGCRPYRQASPRHKAIHL